MQKQDERDQRLAEMLFGDEAISKENLTADDQAELESLQQTLDFLEANREAKPEAPKMDAFWEDFEAEASLARQGTPWYLAAALVAACIGLAVLMPTAEKQIDQSVHRVNKVETVASAEPAFTSAEKLGRRAQMLLLSIANRDPASIRASAPYPSTWLMEQDHAAKLAASAEALLDSADLTHREASLIHELQAVLLQIANLKSASMAELMLLQTAIEQQNLLFKIDLSILRRTMQS